jgi:hypothetical protein
MTYSFTVLQNAKLLATYYPDGRPPTMHPAAQLANDRLVLEELGRYSFRAEDPSGDVEFQVCIGDVSIGELLPEGFPAGGVGMGEYRHWSGDVARFFESARGSTTVHVRTSLAGDAGIDIPMYVVPTKVSEEGYDAMTADIGRLSASLLLDLYGKSRSGRSLVRERTTAIVRSPEEELSLLAAIAPNLRRLLDAIAKRPASVVQRRTSARTCWGHERFTPSMTRDLARTGVAPRAANFPATMECENAVESFDVPEHRITAAFVDLLIRRATLCRDAAATQANSILADRPYRDLQLGDGPSLFQSHDVPRITRLRSASSLAQTIRAELRKARAIPILAESKPQLVRPRHGVFQRSPEYRALDRLMQSYFARVPVAGDYARQPRTAKLTSVLFEQWCFLRLVEGFRRAGVLFMPWEDAMRRRAASQFMIDFDRGMSFIGEIDNGIRMRIRYQPWILGKAEAISLSESLYRGREGQAAWSPDFVIETQFATGGIWQSRYILVLDAKYTRNIQPRHWADTNKYEHIRSVAMPGRQVTKQLWLIHPAATDAIHCEDPDVDFGPGGPTSSSDELQRFVLQTQPATCDAFATGGSHTAFDRFAAGTLAYLRRLDPAMAQGASN